MPRVILLSAFEKYNNGLISTNIFGNLVKFIERFHFVYNGLFSMRTNKLTSIYCNRSKDLSSAATSEESVKIINSFKNELRNALPSEEEFLSKVKELTYIRNEHSQKNMLSKFLLNEIENIISGNKNDKEDSSIEHLNSIETQKIDRLMLLELSINNSIPQISLIEKLPYYRKSNYSVSKQIVEILSSTEEQGLNEALDAWFNENATKFYRAIN